MPIYTYQLRRDTALRWEEVNPVLALAEPGYETNTGFMKIGDGVTPWNQLPYFVKGEAYDEDGGDGEDSETLPPGASLVYVHVQNVPAELWEVTHDLGKYPSVVVIDSAGNMFETDVDYITVNHLAIRFPGPTSGTATMN
jgi:Major tropism determinant N-terminal domain